MLISFLTVFLLSILELWVAVPAGFLLELNPLLIIIAASLGSILAVAIILFVGEKIRNRLIKKYESESGTRRRFLQKIWEKYGIIGLGISSPILFGAPLGAVIGVALGAPRQKLFLWMTIGIIIWSIGLTFAGVQGINIFENSI